MRRLALIGGALAIVLMSLVPACGGDPVTNNPVGPSAPLAGGLQITGPASIAPGQSAQFNAQTRLSDGTVKLVAAQWRSSNPSLLQVTSSGLVTAGQNPGEATITAEMPPLGSTREVIIVPDGTYRVVGSVRDAQSTLPIIGARVEVSGTSLVATTDLNGQYRLYGVPAAAAIQASANGYLSVVQNVQLSTHTTLDFQLSGPPLNLNGPFTVVIDAGGTCPSLADLQRRTYEAMVTTTGSSVEVHLTEPRFLVDDGGHGNWFSGRADAVGVTFMLDDWDPINSFFYPSIVERLPDNTYLVPAGMATMSPTNGGVSGLMSFGEISHYEAFPFGPTLGECHSSAIRLTLTPR